MRSTLAGFLLLTSLGAILASGPSAAAKESSGAAPERSIAIEGVVGFSERSGVVRPRCFAPVHVDLKTKGEPFKGEIVVRSISQEAQAFDPRLVFPCEVGLNTTKRFSDIFFVRESDQSLVAELWVKGRKIDEAHLALNLCPPSRQTILALAEADGRLDHLSSADSPLPSRRRKVIYGKAPFLPNHSRGYEGIDAVVFDGGSPADLADDQAEALKRYLYSGGRIVVCSGGAWQKLESSFLAPMLPVALEGTTVIPSPLPARVSDRPSTAGSPELLVCRAPLRKNPGAVEILWQPEGLDFPLATRRTLGAGSLIFLACRLDEALMRDCALLEGFCAVLFPEREPTRLDSLAQSAADRIDNELKMKSLLPIPSADAIGTALLAYLALFLPALFLAARWWGGDRWAWTAMPAGFVGATLVIFAYGRTEAGRQRMFVQLNFVESRASAPMALGRSFTTVYSTSADHFQVQSPNRSDLFLPLQTTPVKGFPAVPFYYSTRPSAMIRDLEVAARSARSFQLEFLDNTPGGANPTRLIFARRATQDPADPFHWSMENETLTGVVVNETEAVLRQAALIARGQVKSLGALRPGQAVPIQIDLRTLAPALAWRGEPRLAAGQGARDWGAEAALAEAGRRILAADLAPTDEAFLVGCSDVIPRSFAAYSRTGQPPISARTSSGVTWFLIRYPLAVQGGLVHLQTPDFRIEGWTAEGNCFPWDRREDIVDSLAGLSPLQDVWMVRFRPRLGFLTAAGQTPWPVETTWGNLSDDWDGGMDVYDFAQQRWVPAPPRRNGRRILAPPLAPADSTTGELWIRLSGGSYQLKQARLELSLNCKLRP